MSFAAALENYDWGLALALSLTAAAVISFVLLQLFPQKAFQVNPGPGQKRTFRGNALVCPLVFESPSEERRARIEILRVPEGAQARLQPRGEHGHALVVSSGLSGVFSGFSLKVGILDPIGLFNRYEEQRLELAAEFLPISLLTKREEVIVRAAMLGDRPAGSRGFGQEFYTAELYDSSHDSKGILWKRQAMLGSDILMVRVGEANIPETLTICLLESRKRISTELPGWMDLASEAISLIGLTVLDSGSYLRVIHQVGGEATASEARDLEGLADLIVWLWHDDITKQKTHDTAADAGIIVTGEAEIQNPEIFVLLLRKPSVVLSYTTQRIVHYAEVIFFSGKENLGGLVSEVLSR